MYNLSVSYVKSHMVNPFSISVENKISRLHLCRADADSLCCLGTGRPVKADACSILHYVSCEARAVNSGMRIAAAVFVTSAYELKCIIHNLLPFRSLCLLSLLRRFRRLIGFLQCNSVSLKITFFISGRNSDPTVGTAFHHIIDSALLSHSHYF